MIRPNQYFPIGQMLMCLGACIFYGVTGDVRRCIYWAAAVVITASVTF